MKIVLLSMLVVLMVLFFSVIIGIAFADDVDGHTCEVNPNPNLSIHKCSELQELREQQGYPAIWTKTQVDFGATSNSTTDGNEPPLMTNENIYVSISSGNTITTQVESESHLSNVTIDNPYNNLFNGVEYSNDDLKSELFQASQHMVELSTNLSNALEEVAQLKSQIQNMNGTSEEVLQMQTEIQTLKDDRDYWKNLAETWYAIAINQMRIMVDVLGL